MTFLLTRLLAGLGFIGRYGTQGFAVSIFLGLALPAFAAAARPFLAVAIFVFVATTFARVDGRALLALLRRPAPLAIAAAWLVAVPPVLVSAGLLAVGRESLDSGLVLGLAVLAGAPPIMSAPAVAMILGLDATLVTAAVVGTTALSPVVSPIIVDLVAGTAVPLDQRALALRLGGLIGGAVLAAAVLRAILGERRIREQKAAFDGLGVVMYFLFAVAAMDGVLAAALSTPGRVAGYLGIAFAISAVGFAAAHLCLRTLPPGDRFALGYGTGQRNMGLLVAALGAATPPTTFLFFALAQFPIYLMPQVIKPLARRFRRVAGKDERVLPAGR